MPGERLRRFFADVPDPEGEQEPRASLDLLLSISSIRLAADFSPQRSSSTRSVRLEVVDRRDVGEQARGHELIDELLAEPLDVHGAPPAEVAQGLPHDGRTRRVHAARRDLALFPDDRVAADGALLGHLERRRVRGPLFEDHAHDLRDDVAALLDDDGVSDAHVLAREVLVVVERRPLDRRPARRTGSKCATGVSVPVRPTLTPMSRTTVVASSAGYL